MGISNFYRSDGWVKTTLGPAVSGAQVYILSQPANVTPPITPPRTTPVPFVPNPQVLVYSDAGLTQVTQPVITDGFGHYDFYVLPGLYTVAIYYGGKLQQYYIDQSIGNMGSGGGGPLILETNGSPNFNQNLQNLVQGAGIIIATDNYGNTTVTNQNPNPSGPALLLETNGTHNGDQTLLDLVADPGVVIYDDGIGNVHIGSTSASIPLPSSQIYALWQAPFSAVATTFNITNDTVTVSNLSTNTLYSGGATSTSGQYIEFQCRLFAEISATGVPFIYPGRYTTFNTTIAVSRDTDQIATDTSVGLSESGHIIAYGPQNNLSYLVFYAASTVGSSFGTWQVLVNNGNPAAPPAVDTGVIVGPGWTKFEIIIPTGGATAEFYINGTLVYTSTVVPTVNLGMELWSSGQDAYGAEYLNTIVEYLYACNNTP